MPFEIGVSPNIRKSPYFDATVMDGVCAFSVYNHMYIPAHFGDPAAEYRRLIETVALWDVGAQRQVEIHGPDSSRLVQYLCTRDLSQMAIGQGRYTAICNHEGWLINDPVVLRLAEDRFWLSIADSDIGLWAGAIARERGFDVFIDEPDVSPLAIQGPRATELVVDLFGQWVRELRHFQFRQTGLDGIPLVLARSGWSRQDGFELYLQDGSFGTRLWNRVRDAGGRYGIGPGAPNDLERLEGGLLSYGADSRLQVAPANPLELGLDRYVDLNSTDDFVGKDVLVGVHEKGPERKLQGFFIEGSAVSANQHPLPVLKNGLEVGSIGEMAHSSRLQRNIAIGLLPTKLAVSNELLVDMNGDRRSLEPTSMPFIR